MREKPTLEPGDKMVNPLTGKEQTIAEIDLRGGVARAVFRNPDRTISSIPIAADLEANADLRDLPANGSKK